MDQEKFVRLLEGILQPDTNTVKEATALLKRDYYPNPEALALLLQISTSHPDSKLRQLAAVQALGQVSKKWNSIPEKHKPEIRTHLLQAAFNEQVALVRHANSRVIAAIAKIDLADGQWADLPSLLTKAAVGPQVQEREVSTYILFTVLEAMGDEFVSRFQEFFTLYSKTIKDPESADVRMNTMLSLGKMAEIVDGDNDQESLESMQKLLPDMVNVLKQAIEASNEEKIMQGFEVLQSLLEADSKILNKAFRDLINFMATLAGEKALSGDARVQAQNFLISCVMYRKLKFQALRVGEQMVSQILEILTECGGTPHDEDDDDELSLELATLSLLGIMSSNLPPSQVVVPLIPLFKAYSINADPARRQAAMSALGTCAEGAPEFLSTQIPELTPILLQLMEDPEIRVREAATSGIKLLADCLAETMGKDHGRFITGLMHNLSLAIQGLNGPEAKTCANIIVNCCTAIDSLVQGLESDAIKPYLGDLLPALSHLFTHEDKKIKSAAIGAVGSIAEISKEAFTPYFTGTMDGLSRYLHIKGDEEEMDLRSMVCDAMGNMAVAVGPEAFRPYVNTLIAATEEGLHLDNPRLKETTYMFWSSLAKVYKTDFKPFLSGVVNRLHESLQQEESDVEVELGEEAADLVGQEVVIAGKKVRVVNNGTTSKDLTEDENIDEDEDDDDGWADIAGVSAIAEEKEIAMEAMAEVMTHTEREYLPYFEKSIELILPLVEHPYEATRRAAISTLYRAYASLWQLQDVETKKWQPGLPARPEPSTELSKLGQVVMSSTLSVWMAEDDSAVVLEINQNLAETLKLCGPSILAGEKGTGEDVIEPVTQTLVALITKKHVCQQDYDQDSADGLDQESSEDEWYVIETALDVIANMALAIGQQFTQLWKIFEKPVLSYASGTESDGRNSAIGCIADCIKGMGSGVTPFTSSFLKILLHRMADEDTLTKSNAAYAMGMLVQNSEKDQEILKAYNTIMARLEPLLHTESMRQLDNAAGCISRMIMRHKDAIPLAEVLPALVQLLPLKEDFEENQPVYDMIVQLYSSGDLTIQALTPQLMPVLNHVMGPPENQLVPETREKITQLARYVHGKQASMVQPHPNLMAAIVQ